MLIVSWLLVSMLTAGLLAADWFLWEPRYRLLTGGMDPQPGHRMVMASSQPLYAQSASGREVIAAVGPSVPGEVLAASKVQPEWTDHRAGF
jgi:hypothetical protein